MTKDLPIQEETYRILGACFEVYNEMGCGFLEPVYQECLEIELGIQEPPFVSQPVLDNECIRIVNLGRGKLRPPCDGSRKPETPSQHQPDQSSKVDSS